MNSGERGYCNAWSPGGRFICQRTPGHKGLHSTEGESPATWRGSHKPAPPPPPTDYEDALDNLLGALGSLRGPLEGGKLSKLILRTIEKAENIFCLEARSRYKRWTDDQSQLHGDDWYLCDAWYEAAPRRRKKATKKRER